MQGNGDEGLNDDSSSGAGGGVIRREIWELEVRELGVWLKPRDVKNPPPPLFPAWAIGLLLPLTLHQDRKGKNRFWGKR